MTERTERCETCRFWDACGNLMWVMVNDPDGSEMPAGTCRRSPPMYHVDDVGKWALTESFDWCGEWQRKQYTGTPIKFPVESLSVRARNILEHGIERVPKTMDELLEIGRYQISKARNCGDLTISEFDRIAADHNLLNEWKSS